MLKINKIILLFILFFLLVTFIVFIDKWLTNNNPLAMNISNKGGSGIMRLNADGKQHIAQPPQPSSNKITEKYFLENSINEMKNPAIINKYSKEILPIDHSIMEKNKIIIFEEFSNNIKTIDLTE